MFNVSHFLFNNLQHTYIHTCEHQSDSFNNPSVETHNCIESDTTLFKFQEKQQQQTLKSAFLS